MPLPAHLRKALQAAAASITLALIACGVARAEVPRLQIATPMAPPEWALLQRELLRANNEACELFFSRYFDDRGWLLCVERWGGDDGPDDAIENLMHWPVLHALGGGDRILSLYKKAWEGHLRQYTLAKTKEVPFARDGMYYREFPVMFDWLHHSEGLTVFCHQNLSDADNPEYRRRIERFARFYTGEDPTAPNYDPKHKVIKSLFNGSRGPLLRKATAVDWAGDPIEVEGRFSLGHGERSYQEMLDHFKDYNDIVGDHPCNLSSTALAFHAYCATGRERYRQWILEYVDAWAERARQNHGILPSNIGLDGTIGGAAGGKWYGGVYGWGFTVEVPQTKKLSDRNTTNLGLSGFLNAYLLTGEDKYLDVWRTQIETINAQGKTIDGVMQYPHMYGDKGWYAYTPAKYDIGVPELWYCSMKAEDRARMKAHGLADWLDGKRPDYPETTLRSDLQLVRRQVEAIRNDATTPDTRLADDSMHFNPCSIGSLVELTMGGLPPGRTGLVLHCRLRYFDVDRRRAGLPEDVAALVQKMTAEEAVVTLVNVNQVQPRTLVVQAGAYGEHQVESASMGDAPIPVQGNRFTVTLAPGCGGTLTLKMKRYANAPLAKGPF